MQRRWNLIAGVLLGGASLLMADGLDPATAARLQLDREAIKQRLDAIPADRLGEDAAARKAFDQILYLDAQIAGTTDDPLLNNEAIRAARQHQLYLRTLAERAERAKATQAEIRQKLAGNALKPAVATSVNEKVRAGDAAVLDAATGSANQSADYVKAIQNYDAAIAELRATGLVAPPPPKPSNTLEGILVADGVLCPTDEQLRTHAAALNGKPVRVKLKIAAMSRAFAEKGTTDFTTVDGKVRATMQWDQSPADVKKAFAQRSSTKAAMNVGDLVWISGTFRGLEAPEQCSLVVQSAKK